VPLWVNGYRTRLNEGHARRRGEGLADFGSFDLGKYDQLRAVLGWTKSGGYSIVKEHRKLLMSRMRALPDVSELTGALAEGWSSDDDWPSRRQFWAGPHEVEARTTAFFGVAELDECYRIHAVVNDVSDGGVEVEHLGEVEVADKD
jgi:hypothetical protein